ncbi:transglutaminase-like domain-containing protein [Ruminococcaceae bacterium OttesenSCG-928-D13]|nr:transglutaminase-like domain-containing protein [Ruminococcaceae bacterium OttesenSCG-928-D13]
MRMGTTLLAAALLWLALAGCADRAVLSAEASDESAGPASAVSEDAPASTEPAPGGGEATSEAARPCVFDQLADAAIAEMALPENAASFERVKAAFRYVIEHTHYVPFDEADLTDSWRWADSCGQPPTIWQVMAFSPLQYGIGSCENYACALMVLLERMGFDTRYVTGTTYSVQGAQVDHAWAMVAVEGGWYHIDPQLEDNVHRDGTLFYRYFLKSDAEFAASHRWGTLLDNPDPASLELPACEKSAPAVAAEPIEKTRAPELPRALTAAGRLRSAGTDCGLEPEGALPPFPLEAAGSAG